MEYKNKADQKLYDDMIKLAERYDSAVDRALAKCIEVVDKADDKFHRDLEIAKRVYGEKEG